MTIKNITRFLSENQEDIVSTSQKQPLDLTWQCVSLIPAPGEQRSVDLCELSLVCIWIPRLQSETLPETEVREKVSE